MARKTLGKKIEAANVMLAGIRSHKETLDPRGITEQYIEKFAKLTNDCVAINNNQEKAKAALVNLTQQLKERIAELEGEYQFCKRVIITDIPQSLWKEFGVSFRSRKPKPQPEENPDNKPEPETTS